MKAVLKRRHQDTKCDWQTGVAVRGNNDIHLYRM